MTEEKALKILRKKFGKDFQYRMEPGQSPKIIAGTVGPLFFRGEVGGDTWAEVIRNLETGKTGKK
jgi:hypothetical protein